MEKKTYEKVYNTNIGFLFFCSSTQISHAQPSEHKGLAGWLRTVQTIK